LILLDMGSGNIETDSLPAYIPADSFYTLTVYYAKNKNGIFYPLYRPPLTSSLYEDAEIA
jgi:hypothetical protein